MRNKYLNNNLSEGVIAPTRTNYIQAGTGTPVILAHGLAASLHDWDELMPELAAREHACYALDLLGHGESPKPEDLEQYTGNSIFKHMAEWIDTLTLDEPAILIGHSLGGYVSLQYALQYPERVRALILANPFYTQSQLPQILRLFLRRPLLNSAVIKSTPYWFFRLLVDASSLQFGNSQIGRSKEITHCLPENVRIQTALDYKRAAPGIYNIPRTVHELALSNIRQPTLVIWGAHDQTIDPKTFPLLVENLPNARGEVMPFCGHVPHQCHANEFNKKVFDFINAL